MDKLRQQSCVGSRISQLESYAADEKGGMMPECRVHA